MIAALLTGTVLVGTVPSAWATFRQQASAESVFTTAVLDAPDGLVATQRCRKVLLGLITTLSTDVTLTWSPTTSDWATQQVQELVSGLWVVRAELPASAGSWTATGLNSTTSKTYRVVAMKGGWSAASGTASLGACPLL